MTTSNINTRHARTVKHLKEFKTKETKTKQTAVLPQLFTNGLNSEFLYGVLIS